MIKSITLLGSSSGRNAGDAALLSGIMDSIDQAFARRILYEIPTIKPEFIWQNYENRVRPISMLPWNLSIKLLGLPTYQSIMRTDLSLVFDAVLFDRALYNPLFNYLSSLYLLLPLAKQKGKRMACFNVGLGPVDSKEGRRMLRELCERMDFITLRDEASLNLFHELGVKNPRVMVTADSALTVTPSGEVEVERMLNTMGLDPKKDMLGINLSAYLDTWSSPGRKSMGREKFISIFSKALEKVSKELGVSLVFVATQYHDVPLHKAIMDSIDVPVKKVLFSNKDYSHYQLKGIFGKLSLLLGMRLHATILCSSILSPVIALPHQPKVKDYFKMLGLEKYVLDFNDFSEESLFQHLMQGWKDRLLIQRQLTLIIPNLRHRSLIAAQLVKSLAQDEDIEKIVTTPQLAASKGVINN